MSDNMKQLDDYISIEWEIPQNNLKKTLQKTSQDIIDFLNHGSFKGYAWLGTENGRKFLWSDFSLDWLLTKDAILFWFDTPQGEEWSKEIPGLLNIMGPEKSWALLETQTGKKWLRTDLGQTFLSSWHGYRWLQSEKGKSWLGTKDGEEYLDMPLALSRLFWN